MPRSPAPYVTDSVKAGLMAPRPWNDEARRLKIGGLGNAAIAKAVGLSSAMIGHFFSPDSLRKHRKRRKIERVEIKGEPAALAYERLRIRECRAKRIARDPVRERQKEADKRRTLMEKVKADPERHAHYREVRAASARWRRKKRQMIKANPANRAKVEHQHAGA